jgi:hypothetical protein
LQPPDLFIEAILVEFFFTKSYCASKDLASTDGTRLDPIPKYRRGQNHFDFLIVGNESEGSEERFPWTYLARLRPFGRAKSTCSYPCASLGFSQMLVPATR